MDLQPKEGHLLAFNIQCSTNRIPQEICPTSLEEIVTASKAETLQNY
ncbi:1199_t:CDS:2 [Cetraspora pellucida]|uniref:1199_t:CDS:1 n=1 Tax=Cetraspora pellucida TaxID=1433469 RepID=A0ACA9KM30_9GLOM|nr:1199_t:CDS:2 [Cetraspora pellucida]